MARLLVAGVLLGLHDSVHRVLIAPRPAVAMLDRFLFSDSLPLLANKMYSFSLFCKLVGIHLRFAALFGLPIAKIDSHVTRGVDRAAMIGPTALEGVKYLVDTLNDVGTPGYRDIAQQISDTWIPLL